MCKSNIKPEIKQMVVSVKTKYMSKLLEVAIDAEDYCKELDQKKSPKEFKLPRLLHPKERRKKKSLIFRLGRLLERHKILKIKLSGRRNMKGGKMLNASSMKILKISSRLCWNLGSWSYLLLKKPS